jgi:hypothetical protein
MLAIDVGNAEIVEKLIKAGADVNFKNSYGVTPARKLLETLNYFGGEKLAQRWIEAHFFWYKLEPK